MSASVRQWDQYICHACGYIYDEAVGDPDGGLAAGTRFEDIPDEWACPLCGVTKADFEPYSPISLDALKDTQTHAARHGNKRSSRSRQQPGVVIVGAGRAGWQVAEQLRTVDATRPITLVTACAGDVYDKPLLSIAMARQLTADKLIKECGTDAARRLNVTLMAHTHAIRICRDTRQLRTTRGTLRYDELVLAQGAQSALPPHLPTSLCWRINHLGSYLRLQAALGDVKVTGPKDIVILGSGLVGSELANDLALGGHRITLLDIQSGPLARWPATEAATPLLKAWRDLPLQFVGNVNVTKIEKLPTPTGVRLRVTTACGQRFAADQVIAATGLQTPGRLAQGAGLAWNNGIAVDPQTLSTSDAHIHALGDCIAINGQTSRFIEPIARQAKAIVADLCGGTPAPYEVRAAVVRVKTTSLPLTLH